MKPNEPRAGKRPQEYREHGRLRRDEYAWLRDDSRSDPVVIEHLQAENAWFEHYLGGRADLCDRLFEEMTGRLDPDDSSVPYQKRGFWYYHRYESGKEYAIHARRRDETSAAEEIILDENARAEGHAFYRLGNIEASDDHRYLAIAEDTVSRGQHEIRIIDTQAGDVLPEVIENASTSLAWSTCGGFLFYMQKDPETLLAFRVMRHRPGTDPKTDEPVYEEKDKRFYNGLWRSRCGGFIMLAHHSTDTSETQLLRADRPLDAFRPFLPREQGHEYDIDHAAGRFFIRSNWQAVNFRVFMTREAHSTDRRDWREIIGHREEALVLDVLAFEEWLVVAERQDGLRKLRTLSLDGRIDRYLHGTENPSVMWPSVNSVTATHRIRYAYTSLVTPTQVWEADMATGERTLLKSERVLGGYDASNYRTGRTVCIARDGARVPVSYAHHAATRLDGSAPALIYAYGAYGLSTDPWFRNSVVSLLDRGFVYVIAHVRGGQELGRNWYEQGRLRRKWNTFNDFIDVTRALQADSMIDRARTYAMGGSAGGLLMGVIVNEAPELYHGVVAAVPFVDVVTTMLDETLPLTTGEYAEWGDPNVAEDFAYMLSYSPYDQVKQQDHPHLMVTTGLHDAQVQYWEPAKWISRLRERRSNQAILLLKTDMGAGHGGASGRYRQYRESAEQFAFLIDLAGVSGA